jgi:hypothetical protein
MTGVLAVLLGTSSDRISLTNQSLYTASGGLTPTTTTYEIRTTGAAYDGTGFFLEDVVLPSISTSNYEVRATMISGTTPSGTFGSWLRLNALRQWSLTATAGTYRTCTFTIEIRPFGGSTAIDSATIELTADAT